MEEETDLKESAERQFKEGDYDEALSSFQKLLDEQTRELGRTHKDSLHTQSRIASVLEKQMNYAEAARTLIKLYKTKLRTLGILNGSTMVTRFDLAQLLKEHGATVLRSGIFHGVMSCIRLELAIVKKSYLKGKYEEALKSALAIWGNMQAFLSNDHQLIERMAVIVGKIYTAREEYDIALKVFTDIHRKTENLHGHHDRRTASSLMMKACVLHKRCEFDKAMEHCVKAHAIRKDILGLAHRQTLLSLLRIAKINSDIGNHDEALRIMKEVYEKQERNCYVESLHTRISIGLLYSGKSQYEEALDVFHETAQVEYASKRTKVMIQNNIGNLLARLGRYSDSRSVLMKAIKTSKSMNYHADTLSVYRDLAVTLAKEGMLTTAHALLNMLIEASNYILGSRHSVTLSIRSDLGFFYYSQSLNREALYIFTNIWDVREKLLGRFHPDTLHAKFQVAKLYRRQGKTEIALNMYNQVLSLQKAIFYPEQTDCLLVETEIAEIYLNKNSYYSAFEIIYEIYERKVKMYGVDHQYTIEMQRDMIRFGRPVTMRRIIVSSMFENLREVKNYVALGDDVNGRDVNGAVALHYASREGCVDILKFLLSKGAIYNIKDMMGQTPESLNTDDVTQEVFELVKRLFVSVKTNNHFQVRRILEQESSIVNARDRLKRTPLQWAVSKGLRGIVKELLDHGADPLLANRDDGTVLHGAARNGNPDVMAFLIRHVKRTNPSKLQEFVNNKKNSLGLTPLHVAIKQNSINCAEVLMQYDVNPMLCDVFDRIALDFTDRVEIKIAIVMYAFRYSALRS